MPDATLSAPEVLDRETGRELMRELKARSIANDETIVLDLANTRSMDSLGGAWLVEMAQFLSHKHAKLRLQGESGDVAEFVDLVRPSLELNGKLEKEHHNLFEEVGERGISIWDEALDFGGLVVDAIYWTFIAPFDRRGFRGGVFMDELHEMGVRAVRINAMMNFLLGLIIAMLSTAQLEPFGAVIYVADLTAIAFLRELAAIMTAVVVSARTGAAIAAEIATMKVQEEIDALRSMGINVSQYVVAPKLLAMVVVMPCLTSIGMLAGMAGASVWGIFVMDIDYGAWMRQLEAAAQLSDYVEGIYKSLAFAVIIVLIGCHNGFRVRGGSRGVGLMTTRAVVMDIFAIITIDMIFAWMFYYV